MNLQIHIHTLTNDNKAYTFFSGCFIILNINLKQLKLKTEFSFINIFFHPYSKDHSLECLQMIPEKAVSQWLNVSLHPDSMALFLA